MRSTSRVRGSHWAPRGSVGGGTTHSQPPHGPHHRHSPPLAPAAGLAHLRQAVSIAPQNPEARP